MLTNILKIISTPRQWYFIGLGISAVAILAALILQYGFNLEPCPLCVLSRLVVIILGVLFLVAAIHNPKPLGTKIYLVIGDFISTIGIAINIRHLWLQSLPPDQAPACGPNLSYLMQTLPPLEVLSHVLTGSGECAEIQGSFLGLSLPGWTLILFCLLALCWILPVLKRSA